MASSTQAALLIKLRPTGPWRIGPDSGARDRVDRVYHSDTLYSAVTSAMGQLELRDQWLKATAGGEGEPAVRFTSCFPFQGDTLFIPPPRNMWPPAGASRLRFKSTKFVPLEMVRALVDEKPLAEDRWIIDPASECLLRSDRAANGGPYRIAVRTSAAVDRVTHGAVDVHSVAVLEFGERAGLWTLAVFRDETARAMWKNSVQAAFRLLADSGFGGERSNGFGHSQMPQFQDCRLPDFILRPPGTSLKQVALAKAQAITAKAEHKVVSPVEPMVAPVTPDPADDAPLETLAEDAAEALTESLETAVVASVDGEPGAEAAEAPAVEVSAEEPEPEVVTTEAQDSASEPLPEDTAQPVELAPAVAAVSESEEAGSHVEALEAVEAPVAVSEPVAAEAPPAVEVDSYAEGLASVEAPVAVDQPVAVEAPVSVEATAAPPIPAAPQHAFWVLSLFSPAESDAIDWNGGSYSVVTRGGRVESSARWGVEKRMVRMIAEGSVLRAPAAPLGAAPNVAPEGFPHPVYRSGFAVSIEIPWRVNL